MKIQPKIGGTYILRHHRERYRVRITGSVPFFNEHVIVMRYQWKTVDNHTGSCWASDLEEPDDVVTLLANAISEDVEWPVVAQSSAHGTSNESWVEREEETRT